MKQSLFFLFALVIFAPACKKSPANDSALIPVVNVYYQVYLNDPLYSKLNYNNNYVYIENIGVKGLIVANVGGIYYALERDCPYNPNDACAKVAVESTLITIRCGSYDSKNKWTSCCDSKFQLDGTLISGPAKYSLKRYNVSTSPDGTTLTITN
jgi:nitrite reductase/ring-hydroxylating ferredoxin subunit